MCNKLFTDNRKLEEHQDTHIGKAGNLYECYFCGNKYKVKRYLKTHIESKHLRTEAAQIRLIAESLKRVIKMKNSFPCNECPKKFSSKYGKIYHMNRVHSTAKRNVICCKCGKAFVYKQDLTLHMKNYHCHKTCQICDAIITANRFKAHMRTHTGNKNITVKRFNVFLPY